MNTNLNDKEIGEIIRGKLDSLEFSYNHNEWLRLEKNLPGPKTFPARILSKYPYHVAAIATVITVVTLSVFFLIPKKVENHQNQPILTTNPNHIIQNSPQNFQAPQVKNPQNFNEKTANTNQSVSHSVTEINNTKVQNSNSNVTSGVPLQGKGKPEIQSAVTTIRNQKSLPEPDFSYNIQEGCSPLSVHFYPQPKNDSIFYIWRFDDGQISTDISPVHKFLTPGTYDIVLTIRYFKSNIEKVVEKKNLITVKKTPDAEFAYDRNLNTFTFNPLNNNAESYKWIINGEEVQTSANLIYEFHKNGNYIVNLIAYNSDNCSDSETKTINFTNIHNIYMPNAFTPDGDGKNDYFGPAGDNLEDYKITMDIFNSQGRLIYSTHNVPWDGKMMGNNQAASPGTYVWKLLIIDKYGNTESKMGQVNLLRNDQ